MPCSLSAFFFTLCSPYPTLEGCTHRGRATRLRRSVSHLSPGGSPSREPGSANPEVSITEEPWPHSLQRCCCSRQALAWAIHSIQRWARLCGLRQWGRLCRCGLLLLLLLLFRNEVLLSRVMMVVIRCLWLLPLPQLVHLCEGLLLLLLLLLPGLLWLLWQCRGGGAVAATASKAVTLPHSQS